MTVLRQPVQQRHYFRTMLFCYVRNMTLEQTAQYFNQQPEIFKGETQMLTNLAAAAEDTGQIGAIPPLYYELQQLVCKVSKTSLRYVETRRQS